MAPHIHSRGAKLGKKWKKKFDLLSPKLPLGIQKWQWSTEIPVTSAYNNIQHTHSHACTTYTSCYVDCQHVTVLACYTTATLHEYSCATMRDRWDRSPNSRSIILYRNNIQCKIKTTCNYTFNTDSGVPRGGDLGGSNPSWNSEDPPKSYQTQPDCENC